MLEVWRNKWDAKIAAEGIDMRLVLNYDQIWRVRYRGSSTNLFKESAESGQMQTPVPKRSKKRQLSQSMRKSKRASANAANPSEECCACRSEQCCVC